MNWDICKKTILKTASIAIFAILFYTACDDNGVKVVTPEVETFEDKRDGKIYKKVRIGDQIWMAENLRYEADGSVCNDVGWWNPPSACEYYGRLYDWNTAMNGEHSSNSVPSGVEGVCPVGWHIPSDAEWTELIDYVGVNAGTKLKAREFHDNTTIKAPDGTDKYRFSALPGGRASYIDGVCQSGSTGTSASWWSSTERESDDRAAWIREIYQNRTEVLRWYMNKHEDFLSVRCVHD